MTRQLLAIALLSLSAFGCKQGVGERCQTNADCASGQCSMAEPRVCRASGDDSNEMIDAEPPPPPPPPPPPSDAAIDAAADAARD